MSGLWKIPAVVLAIAWAMVAIFVVLLPLELVAAVCFLTGHREAGDECMEAALWAMYGPLEWIADAS